MMVCLAAPSTESPAGDPRAAETEFAADARAELFLVFSLSLVADFVRPNGLSTWSHYLSCVFVPFVLEVVSWFTIFNVGKVGKEHRSMYRCRWENPGGGRLYN